jgi:DNA-binding response OmpR family regulator
MTHRLALVVDDSSTARITLKRMLEKQDIDTDTVDSAQKAIDYLVEKTPNVIFMDHMMPGMDGLQAPRKKVTCTSARRAHWAPSAFCQRRWNPPNYIKSSTNSG